MHKIESSRADTGSHWIHQFRWRFVQLGLVYEHTQSKRNGNKDRDQRRKNFLHAHWNIGNCVWALDNFQFNRRKIMLHDLQAILFQSEY